VKGSGHGPVLRYYPSIYLEGLRLEKKSFASAGDRTPVVQSVVRHCTYGATPAPKLRNVYEYFHTVSHTIKYFYLSTQNKK
jgi:hypothetical protein